MISLEEFKNLLPEFKTDLPDSYLLSYIRDAWLFMGDYNVVWGKRLKYQLAQAYLAAHYAVRAGLVVEEGADLNPKIITSESIGDMSYTRGGVNVLPKNYIQDEFNTTLYGMRFLQMMENRSRFPMI